MNEPHIHLTQPDIVNRLKRAEGHLRTIISMVEEHRSCLEVAQQLHAVEKAVSAAKKVLIHDHIHDCLEHAVVAAATGDGHSDLSEFKEITKYL